MNKKLIDLFLHTKAFQYDDKNPFILSCGNLSNYYINCKKVTLTPEGMNYIGHLIYKKIRNLDIQGIGGMTLGADPIAYATMAIAYQYYHKCIKTFVVRKTKKIHGLNLQIEGSLQPGDNVVIVDDIVTTGQSTITAIKHAQNYGLIVKKVIILIDRHEHNGMEHIAQMNIPVETLLNKDEIISGR